MGRHNPPLREILYEFTLMGRYVKVAAVDPATLTEVTLVGDPSVGEAVLKRQARRKLEYVLAKAREGKTGGRKC